MVVRPWLSILFQVLVLEVVAGESFNITLLHECMLASGIKPDIQIKHYVQHATYGYCCILRSVLGAGRLEKTSISG